MSSKATYPPGSDRPIWLPILGILLVVALLLFFLFGKW